MKYHKNNNHNRRRDKEIPITCQDIDCRRRNYYRLHKESPFYKYRQEITSKL